MTVEMRHVYKAYAGQPVLSDFSLALPEKGTTAFCGPSGCGKTTLVRLIAGLERVDDGSIAGLAGKRISMVFQEDRLLPWCTAEQNIALAAPHTDAGAWLAGMGLAAARRKLPGELSGGMRRRVAIARALAYGGDLFLLDEPFKALDDATRASVMACAMRAIQEKPALLVTHELEEAAAMADTVLLLDGPPLRVLKAVALPVPQPRRDGEQIREYCRQLEQVRGGWLK